MSLFKPRMNNNIIKILLQQTRKKVGVETIVTEEKKSYNNKLLYRIDHDPPWLLAVILGFQVIFIKINIFFLRFQVNLNWP